MQMNRYAPVGPASHVSPWSPIGLIIVVEHEH